MNVLSINELVQGAVKSYLDPGAGNIIVQLLLGTVLGLGVFFRLFWKKIKKIFDRGNGKSEDVLDPTAVVEDLPQNSSDERMQ